MNNDEKHIESLLTLFMQGETTLEQERKLRRFFASTHNVPQEWQPYKEMMAYFDDGMPIAAGPSNRQKITRQVWVWVAAAAIVAIVIMVAPKKSNTTCSVISKTLPIITTKIDTINILEPTEAKHHKPMITMVEKKDVAKADKKETVKVKDEKSVNIASHNTERMVNKQAPRHETTLKVPLDAAVMEREQGEMEQTQQELMADKYIIEQERQEILEEQYSGRVQAYQAQQAFNNENPQLISVVFK